MTGRQKIGAIITLAIGIGIILGYFVLPQPLTFNLLPANDLLNSKNYRGTTTNIVIRGCYDIGVEFTKDEASESKRCADNFAQIREEQRRVNYGKMESDRWTKHSYLRAESRIVDVGGFKGVDAEKFIHMANSFYIVLEPVPEYYKILEKQFSKNPKVTLYKFGLGKENKTLQFDVLSGDATSLFSSKRISSKGGETQTLNIRQAKEFFTSSLNVQEKPIDLLTINCEGCEYELLELVIAEELAQYFKHIQFQFHVDLPGIVQQECRYCQIMNLLNRTHSPMFQFSYTWQAWQLK
ncbi:uncharacterized protein LOC121380110 [Gigantopelta aegis]|uniref:uncharacterized protein LOC121380110 n=1 Tax=Gigantopelta aegis TaxID=1735272 RepID=UPI001B888010|nr:uncharacterized protein LOC121380110 [Gigantopelta aegis]XP_041364816.1 uncharacterized protein LOC121380110 [Gigantopelta aegis]XP_041364817.1 uncharacterized protein LOC121380110 [Gigantopelta aegis]